MKQEEKHLVTLVKEGSGRGRQEISSVINITPTVGRSPRQLDWLGSQVVGGPGNRSRDGLTPQDPHSEDAAWILIHK